jgi:hypothetical protein
MHHNSEDQSPNDRSISLHRWLEGFALAASFISPSFCVQRWIIEQQRTRR